MNFRFIFLNLELSTFLENSKIFIHKTLETLFTKIVNKRQVFYKINYTTIVLLNLKHNLIKISVKTVRH